MHDNLGVEGSILMNIKFPRLLKLPMAHSLFLFGARNTGKSTLIQEVFKDKAIVFDLLKTQTEARFSRNPDELSEMVMALPGISNHKKTGMQAQTSCLPIYCL